MLGKDWKLWDVLWEKTLCGTFSERLRYRRRSGEST
jgi:hypothetical protein